MTGDHLFQPGRVQASQHARALDIDLDFYLNRHHSGDWGKVPHTLQVTNDRAVTNRKGAIASAYETPAGWLFVYTNADWSATALLLPSDVEAYLQ